LFAAAHSLTAGIVTLLIFVIYTLIENHVLNPLVMSRTVKISPLLVLVSILVGAPIGDWIGGLFGGFAAGLLAIPTAGAIQAIVRETRIPAKARQAGMHSADQKPNEAQPAPPLGRACSCRNGRPATRLRGYSRRLLPEHARPRRG
jgi:predicted PurR-regulated permease PerM